MSESFQGKLSGQLLTLGELLLALCPSVWEMFVLVWDPDCSWLHRVCGDTVAMTSCFRRGGSW